MRIFTSFISAVMLTSVVPLLSYGQTAQVSPLVPSVFPYSADVEDHAGTGTLRGSHCHLEMDPTLRARDLWAAGGRTPAEIIDLAHGWDICAYCRPVDVSVPRRRQRRQTVDFYLSETRDCEAAKLFLEKSLANPDNRRRLYSRETVSAPTAPVSSSRSLGLWSKTS